MYNKETICLGMIQRVKLSLPDLFLSPQHGIVGGFQQRRADKVQEFSYIQRRGRSVCAEAAFSPPCRVAWSCVEPHFTFTLWREVDFALLGDTLTIRELSFSPHPALGLVLSTASPHALGTMASKTPLAAAELLPRRFSQGCLHTLSWPTGISLKFPPLLWVTMGRAGG